MNPAQRIACYLAVVIGVGVPASLVVDRYAYSPTITYCLVLAGLLATFFLGVAVFVTKVGNKTFTRVCRVGAALLSAVLVAVPVFGASRLARTIAEERADVETVYTYAITTYGCWHNGVPYEVTIAETEDGSHCRLTVSVDTYSVVIYPDGVNVTLGDLTYTQDGNWLTVTFPVTIGRVTVLLYSYWDGGLGKLRDMNLDPTAPHYTWLNASVTA